MNIVGVCYRQCRLAISSALIFSISAPIVLFVGSNPSTVALAGQKPSSANSNDRSPNIDDKSITRARRAESKSGNAQNTSPSDGPIIRVALMTDVSSVALNCASGLRVRRVSEGLDDASNVPTGALNVELRQLSDPVKSDSRVATKYKAQTTSTSRSAERHPTKLVALAPDRVAVTSDTELVIAPGGGTLRLDQDNPSTGSTKTDRDTQLTNARNPNKTVDTESKTAPAVRIGKTEYRGEMILILNPRGRIDVVNALPLEQYLRGVVPMELSPGAFPEIEALKAQAIAARSYALARLGQHRNNGFDLVDDTRAQVYGGRSAERELTNRAIAETRGIAVVFNNDGKPVPIEALYTANCGGRTENNEEVFGGRPSPYLRAVSCSPDRHTFTRRDITSGRSRDAMIGTEGRSIAREVGLLSVLGFSIARRPTNSYLSKSPYSDEIRSWIEQTARVTQRGKPNFTRGDGTRLAEFIGLVAVSVYGEGRARTLLSPADVDYLLDGLRVQTFPREARADVAMLVRDGILRVPADAPLDGRAPITRGQMIETLARAISINHPGKLRTQLADSKSQLPNTRTHATIFVSEIALPADHGRLVIDSSGSNRDSLAREKGRYTSVNASAAGRIAGQRPDEPLKTKSSVVGRSEDAEDPATVPRGRDDEHSNSLEISEDAWLFRNIAGESHHVDRLNLIGGERVVYHLNAKGQVDFLEAFISDRSASSDRFSSVAQWQERITAYDLQQRLARARINVGQLTRIDPVAFSSSSRVTEVEVTGSEGTARLRRSQIRATLGLKEYLFVVDREIDASGKVAAFVFTGRGWGHGVGMCQTGAYGLAKDGYSHAAILQKYYSGVTLHKIY